MKNTLGGVFGWVQQYPITVLNEESTLIDLSILFHNVICLFEVKNYVKMKQQQVKSIKIFKLLWRKIRGTPVSHDTIGLTSNYCNHVLWWGEISKQKKSPDLAPWLETHCYEKSVSLFLRYNSLFSVKLEFNTGV